MGGTSDERWWWQCRWYDPDGGTTYLRASPFEPALRPNRVANSGKRWHLRIANARRMRQCEGRRRCVGGSRQARRSARADGGEASQRYSPRDVVGAIRLVLGGLARV